MAMDTGTRLGSYMGELECVCVFPPVQPKKRVSQSNPPQPREATLARTPTARWAHLARSKRSRRPSVQRNEKEMAGFTPGVGGEENGGEEEGGQPYPKLPDHRVRPERPRVHNLRKEKKEKR